MASCEDKLREMALLLEKLSQAAKPFAEVVKIKGKETILRQNSQYLSVQTKDGIAVGDLVSILSDSMQIMDKLDIARVGGIASVLRRLDKERLQVSSRGESTIVSIGGNLGEINPGDQVLLNSDSSMALFKIPEEKKPPLEIPNVKWADIGGQSEAKHELREAIEYPRKFAHLWKHYNKRQTKGVLLFGPPGCGKTMLGKAVATALGQEFIYAKGPEILDPYVGVAEAKLRDLMAQASQGKVLFLDEADAILGARGTRNSFMEKTIVPTFLTEIDGIETFKGTVILASNRADILDPAVLRDGRIDRKIEVKRPDMKDVATIFDLYLDRIPHEGNGELSKHGAGMVFDPERKLPTGKAFSSLASGALVEGIVDKAISSALVRDMKANKPSKVTKADLEAGVLASFNQNHAVMAGGS